MTASIGPGVTYTSSELVTTPLGQGREAIYAFTDVSQLRISTQPAAPGGIAIKTQGFSTQPSAAESITFTMTHDAERQRGPAHSRAGAELPGLLRLAAGAPGRSA